MDKKRILVVEDTHTIANVVYDLLSPKHEVSLCFDGKSAVARALEEPFELIVTDVLMPGMSGLELAKVLRNNKQTRRLPIVALTGRAEEALGAEAKEAFTSYLVKPFGLEDLPALVDRLLEEGEG